MLEIAVQLVFVGIIIAVVAFILQAAVLPRYQFIVQVHGEKLVVTRGKVRGEFLDEARLVCQECGVTSGWIGGVRRGKSIALKFSSNIPPNCQQRLRNLWYTG
jgi:hypothetical protein